MTGVEWAAIITALGAFIAACGGLVVNARKIEEQNKLLAAQADEIAALKRGQQLARRRARFLKKLLLQRESENNRLLARETKWQDWGDDVGRMLNQLQLEVGALQQQLKAHDETDDDQAGTHPLKYR